MNYLSNHLLPVVVGSTLGFSVFAVNLLTLPNALFRKDAQGITRFKTSTLLECMTAPFNVTSHKFAITWGIIDGVSFKDRVESMLGLNWVFCTAIGATCGYAVSKFITL